MEKRFNILIVVALISLVFNVYTVRVLEKQSDELAQLQHRMQNAEQSYNNVSSSLNNFSHELRQLKEGEAWVLSEKFAPNMEDSSREQVYLQHEVAFREVTSNARVYVQYREVDTDAWTKVPAARQGGLFSSTLVLNPAKFYQYQLVEEGSTVRSGTVNSVPSDYYRPSRLRFGGRGGRITSNGSGSQFRDYTMTFTQGPVYFDFYEIKEVRARIMNGSELVKTLTLPKSGHPYKETEWELRLDGIVATNIFLEIEYVDGSTEELQVWPDPDMMEYEEYIGQPGN